MNIINKLIIPGLALSLLVGTSCNKQDLNNNPNSFSEIKDPNLILGQAEFAVGYLNESQPARFAGLFSDQFTGFDRQYISYDKYIVTSGDFDDAWFQVYTGLAQTRIVQKNAIVPVTKGKAQLYEALLVGDAAALFGDIPYSQAIQPTEYPSPKYDKQTEVLAAVQDVLDKAITNMGAATVSGSVFVNNGTSLSKIAQSLKARYYMVAKDYQSAYNAAKEGMMSGSESLSVRHTATGGQQNLYYQFCGLQRGGYLTADRSHMQKLINGTAERLLATPGDAKRSMQYFKTIDDVIELNWQDGVFKNTASFPVISGVENMLVLAEAAYRTDKEEEALGLLNQVRAYLATTYDGEFPASTASGEDLLKQILEEKYLSLPGSLQVFSDLRRTNNLLGVPVKSPDATTIPQRFLYPQSEINANKNFPGLKDLYTPTEVNM